MNQTFDYEDPKHKRYEIFLKLTQTIFSVPEYNNRITTEELITILQKHLHDIALKDTINAFNFL